MMYVYIVTRTLESIYMFLRTHSANKIYIESDSSSSSHEEYLFLIT